MSDKVKKYGKIRYIEPNDFLNRDGSNNVIQNYEDYSISVDLTVKVPNRLGTTMDDNVIVLVENKHINGNNFSFFSGTDGYFTSNPGSVIYEDICSSNTKSINENLGITSINIAYNSYHHPEVTINFTDIRGSALMMPHEENYRQEQVNSISNKKVYDKQVENFFSSLFSFPSPEFILHVKGFYGKKVEYHLLVVDFRSSFNNETGNFDATVKFIGKLYGLYTDIPMNYLLVAPYCKYGNSNNMTIWESENFRFSNGTRIPTFLELKEKIARSNTKLDQTVSLNSLSQYNLLRNEQISLQEIKNNLDELINFITKNYKNNEYVKFVKSNIVFLYHPETKCNYLYPNDKNDELSSYIKKLYESIRNFNSTYSSKLPFIDGILSEINKIGQEEINYFTFENKEEVDYDKGVIYNDGFKLIELKIDSEDKFNDETVIKEYDYILSPIKKELERKYGVNVKGKFSYVFISYEKLEKNIKDFLFKNDAALIDSKKALTNETNQYLESILGFVPSIKNVFKILMAHLQTFSKLFNTLISNINSDEDRSLKKLNLSFDNLIDLPNNKSNTKDIKIPPFPALRNKSTNDYCYVSDLSFDTEERKFIDAFFDCTFDYIDADKKINDILAEKQNDALEIIPTCVTDLYYRNNPYKYVFDNNNSTIFLDWIYTFFGLRLISALNFEQNFTPGKFAKFEAYNFWRANKNLGKEIINKIKSNDFNSENFIKFLSNEKNPYILNNKPCYSTDNFKKLANTNTIYVTVNTENPLPAVITRDDNSFKTFWKDIETCGGFGDGKHTFLNKSKTDKKTIPFEYIKFIDDNIITSWKEVIEESDLPKIFGEEDVTVDISQYKPPMPSFFTWTSRVLFGDDKIYKTLKDTNKISKYTEKKHNADFKRDFKVLQDVYNEDLPPEYNLLTYSFDKYTTNSGDFKSEVTPCFLASNLSPEDFIINIFVDNMVLYFELLYIQDNSEMHGKRHRLIKLPYVMQLFIGMFIYAIKENRSDIINKCAKCCNDIEDLYKQTYNSDRFSSIIPLICLFLRKKVIDGNNTYYTLLDKNDNYRFSNLNKTGQSFSHFKQDNIKGECINSLALIKEKIPDILEGEDFLGLVKTYKEWAQSEAPGGFLYFKKMYEIEETKLSYSDNAYYWNKGTSNEVKMVLSKDSTLKHRVAKYFKNIVNDSKEVEQYENKINKAFQAVHNNTKSSTPFTDRYSCVLLMDDNLHLVFNKEFEAYKHLNEFFKKTNTLMYVASEGKGLVLKTDFSDNFQKFKKYLIAFYDSDEKNRKEVEKEGKTFTSNTVSIESKLSMYRTLKNIYDKHFATLPRDIKKFDINEKDSEFERIHYVDTFFKDLGDEMIFNADTIIDIIDKISTTGVVTNNGVIQTDINMYSFMSLLCEKHNMMLLAMPVFNGNFTTKNGIDNFKTMFTPIPYEKCINENVMSGPSYICFYPHQPSQHLDIPNSQYRNDGFNIIEDINNTGNFTGPVSIQDLQDDGSGYVIPAFSVEYGSQKQSIFKSVNVNMDNPQTTEVAIANQFNIAQTNNTDFTKLGFEGQDLYRIYSNYSYTCEVEMMGCAQILPLMYFQLNNIPMFRGTYQIIKVEHDITPGNMITKFKGVRINSTKIPLVKNGLNFNTINEVLDQQTGFNKTEYNVRSFKGNLFGDTSKESIIPFTNSSPNEISYDSVINNYKNVSFSNIQTFDSIQSSFDNLNPELRKMFISISKRMSDNNLGINVTSMTRRNTNKNSSSDHTINSPNAKEKRKLLTYDMGNGEKRNGVEVGCAIDMNGLCKGVVDKTNGSIPLFHLIATEFTKNIRQLIWEVKDGFSPQSDNISNCIHLASYGDIEANNYTCNIYVGTGSTWSSYLADNAGNYKKAPRNLPPMFIRTLCDLAKKPDLYKNVTLNNFKSNRKPTLSDLEQWCLELDV